MIRLPLLGILALAALSSAPAGAQTFVDRIEPGDLRVVSYNVLWNTIFPAENPTQAAKFDRVVNALDPDILALQEIDFDTDVSEVLDLMDDIAPLPSGGWYGHKAGDCVTVSKHPLTMQAEATIPAGHKDQAMALVDLPDALFSLDVYVMNNHYKCCGGFDFERQRQSDSIIAWMRDARTPGGFIDLAPGTPMMVVGDLNIVEGIQPLQTLIDGNIMSEFLYGADSPPDWDGTDSLDERPLHNEVGPADWTWSSPGPFPPGRLDFIITTNSVLQSVHTYVLNTTTMSPAELTATGLQANDVTVDSQGIDFDHLPLVVDYRPTFFWTGLGNALAGTAGPPALVGTGSLSADELVTLDLDGALPGGSAFLVLGLSDLNAPFKGGVLVPNPDVVIPGLPLDGNGDLDVSFVWPAGIPGGAPLTFQYWIPDAGGPAGFAASNAVTATTP